MVQLAFTLDLHHIPLYLFPVVRSLANDAVEEAHREEAVEVRGGSKESSTHHTLAHRGKPTSFARRRGCINCSGASSHFGYSLRRLVSFFLIPSFFSVSSWLGCAPPLVRISVLSLCCPCSQSWPWIQCLKLERCEEALLHSELLSTACCSFLLLLFHFCFMSFLLRMFVSDSFVGRGCTHWSGVPDSRR